MIISSNQCSTLVNLYNNFLSIAERSPLSFPFGLPGWKCLRDLADLSEKLCHLNRIPIYQPRPREDAASLWFHLHMEMSLQDDDDEKINSLIRISPALCRLAEEESQIGL